MLARSNPLLIDESDATLDAFPAARALGYSGVSSKTCKGLYKSIINAARCAAWNADAASPRFFLSAEDLTTQAGVAVQQEQVGGGRADHVAFGAALQAFVDPALVEHEVVPFGAGQDLFEAIAVLEAGERRLHGQLRVAPAQDERRLCENCKGLSWKNTKCPGIWN